MSPAKPFNLKNTTSYISYTLVHFIVHLKCLLKVYDLWKVVDGSSPHPTYKETTTSASAVTGAPGPSTTTQDDTEDTAVTSDTQKRY